MNMSVYEDWEMIFGVRAEFFFVNFFRSFLIILSSLVFKTGKIVKRFIKNVSVAVYLPTNSY